MGITGSNVRKEKINEHEEANKKSIPVDMNLNFLTKENRVEFESLIQKIVTQSIDFKLKEKVLENCESFDKIFKNFGERIPHGSTGY